MLYSSLQEKLDKHRLIVRQRVRSSHHFRVSNTNSDITLNPKTERILTHSATLINFPRELNIQARNANENSGYVASRNLI